MNRREFLISAGAAGIASMGGGLFTQCVQQPQSTQESGILLGIWNRPWGDLTLEEALDAIKASGFEYCGFFKLGKQYFIEPEDPTGDAERARPMIESRGLKPRVLAVIPDLTKPVKELLDLHLPQIDAAKSLGVTHILNGGTEKKELYDKFYEVMKYFANEMLKRDMLIVTKPHDGISATGAMCAEVAEKINSEGFKICYDPGNVKYYVNVDPAEDVKSVAKYVKMVSIKDCKGSRVTNNGDVMVTPGDGEVDLKTVFDVLISAGLSGPCLIETVGGKTKEEKIAEAIKAKAYMEKIIQI